MEQFLALITPLTGSAPGQPPGIWGGAPPYVDIGGPGSQPGPSHPIALPPGSVGGTPEHPIYYPPSPPGQPSHPIVLPPNSVGGTPEHPIYYPPTVWPPGGHPSHPIAPGGKPPGYWGGEAPPYPDHGLPVPPTVWPPEPIAPLPPDLESVVVVAVHKPGQDWEVKTYPVAPSQGLPEVDPRRRR